MHSSPAFSASSPRQARHNQPLPLLLRRLLLASGLLLGALLLSQCESTGGRGFSRVVIDPGHGGHDPGASRAGIHEKHLALDVSTRVSQILRRRGVPVKMTRSNDRFLTLGQRVRIADRTHDSALVSIHFNSARRSGAAGIETFHYRNGGRTSRDLARAVQRQLIRKTRANDRGVKSAGFYVLRKTKRPAILVECGFVSNRRERYKSLQSSYRQRLAEGIAAGIMEKVDRTP